MRGSVALLLLALTGLGAAVRKRWTPNWDLNSRSNWRDQQLPCAGGVAALPRYPDNSLFLGSDLTLGSLDLPVEGELILGDNARLVFDHTSGGGCEDAEWSHRGRDQWWDPEAWSYPGFDDPVSSPVPHLHRVPCPRDAALFATTNDSLFTVHLAPPPVFVSTLSIGKRNFTTSEFAAYTRTTEGALRFRGVSSTTDGAPLYVESPGECVDLTGCLCGTEQAASVICRIMSTKCGTPRCDNPIDMTGFCCPVCGAEVTIEHGGTLALETINVLLHKHLQTPAMRDVRGHVAKMSDKLYHVYFTAVSASGSYKEASEAFKAKFNKELNVASSHEVLVSYAGDMKPLVSGKVAPQHVAVTLVTLTICLVIGAAVYYLRKRRLSASLSFMFRRLENNSRRVSVVSDMIGGRRPSNASGVFAYSRESGLRFLNPIFNQSMASLSGVGVSSVINEAAQDLPAEQAGQHENPMYTAFQGMLPEEQQASEEAIREREKILQAAGQVVASMESSQRDKTSSLSGKNLEAITEERETKDDMSSDLDMHNETEGKSDDKPPTSNSASVLDENMDILSDSLLLEENEDEASKSSKYEKIHSKENEEDAAHEETGEMDDQSSLPVASQTIIDIDEAAPVSSGHLEHQESSSSSSDGDATDALSSLEGFTPLVDLKFKK